MRFIKITDIDQLLHSKLELKHESIAAATERFAILSRTIIGEMNLQLGDGKSRW